MSTNFAKHVSVHTTPQTRAIPGRESDMTPNNAGGVVFKLDQWKTLERFLIMGTEGGSFYVSEEKATVKASESLAKCVQENPRKVVDLLTQISDSGRAISNDYALFALAFTMAFAPTDEDKFYARQSVNKVARIGTHILHFAEFINQLKGWGSGTRKAFQQWYLQQTPEALAYQYMKYKQRDGWSHRDILRLSHPYGSTEQNNIFNYITKIEAPVIEGVKPSIDVSVLPEKLQASLKLAELSETEMIEEILRHKLPREVIPTERLNSPTVWKALLPAMGLTAMIRNLGKMTSIGLMLEEAIESYICKSMEDRANIQSARVHPVQILFALKTYASGAGFRGSLRWIPSQRVIRSLEIALEDSFTYVVPSGKRHMFALDISGSMHMYSIRNSNVTCREAAVVMAMVNARKEANFRIIGFSNDIIDITNRISPSDSFRQAMINVNGMPFGRTDCSAPMLYALDHKLDIDMFSVYTDNETYTGRMQPSQALVQYRKARNIPNCKMAVVGMTATDFTIADPKDPYMIDIAGFDPNTPQLISTIANL